MNTSLLILKKCILSSQDENHYVKPDRYRKKDARCSTYATFSAFYRKPVLRQCHPYVRDEESKPHRIANYFVQSHEV